MIAPIAAAPSIRPLPRPYKVRRARDRLIDVLTQTIPDLLGPEPQGQRSALVDQYMLRTREHLRALGKLDALDDRTLFYEVERLKNDINTLFYRNAKSLDRIVRCAPTPKEGQPIGGLVNVVVVEVNAEESVCRFRYTLSDWDVQTLDYIEGRAHSAYSEYIDLALQIARTAKEDDDDDPA